MTSPAQSIDELVRPLATAAGLEVWDVEVNPRMVRVLVDRQGGVDLEAVAGVARLISAALDERDDLVPGRNYELEVGSPGVERTLRILSHYQRYIGATVAVKTSEVIDGSRRLQGVLQSADEAGITIDSDNGLIALPYEKIQKARTVLLWAPPAKSSAAATQARAAAGASRTERTKDVAR
jgi:ribosome maturation factor RimP